MKKGFSLIILIITVIVFAIIGLIIVGKEAKIDENFEAIQFVNNVSMIQEKVIQLNDNHETNNAYQLIGTQINDPITIGEETYPSLTNTGIWYYIEENVLPDLGVDLVKGNYIVNYENGKVVSVDGVKYKNIIYYSLDEILTVIDVSM